MNLNWVVVRALALALLPTMTWARGLPPNPNPVPTEDAAFLEEVERRCFRFFWEQANPTTGLIADRARADGSEPGTVCSIASIGFGLTGICIADARGWIPRAEAYRRVLTTLRHLWEKQEHVRGFYYHFLDMKTGARVWNCELSSIDTALLMAGVLTARQYYRGTEVERLATRLYERVDWDWMRNGGDTLTMGWTPENGFLEARWDGYSEHPMLYLMALGSPTHPVPLDTWMKWKREPVITYAGMTYLQCPPLFTHQYSQAWVDFRDKRDAFADYWHNSVLATHAHRQFCYDIGYAPNLWGITASDSRTGYRAWGGPPKTPDVDGTVVPCAPGGSIPFAPSECLAALREMQKYTWTQYGYADAFHPGTGWVNPDVIGLDVGITLLMAENYRSGFVWHYFMRNPEIQRAMTLAGFRRTGPNTVRETRYLHTLARDTWRGLATIEKTRSQSAPASLGDIGLHLTSIVAAHELGIIRQQVAEKQIARALKNLPSPCSWETASARDAAMLAAGLITVAQAFPRFREQCDSVVRAIPWNRWVSASGGSLGLAYLGSDVRLAYFFAIASGEAPPEVWDRLDRSKTGNCLMSDSNQPDLLEQYLPSLWLDERETVMGRSAQNLAFTEMQSSFPWGRLGGDEESTGSQTKAIVGPHLAAMALADFPREVVANLQELERRGARHPRYGFYDALDTTTGKAQKRFSTQNQAMLLVSLANHLRHDAIRRRFQAASLVAPGRALIEDYRQPQFRNCSVFTLEPRPPDIRTP
ncbi:MAG: hypothetical protein NZ483_04325 [Verrucomicrobiae bacterium]|nr:hypothetical protein [Verrucomicrobiae bacterium]